MTDKLEIDKTKVEFLVEPHVRGRYRVVRLTDGFADDMGEFDTYTEAFRYATNAAAGAYLISNYGEHYEVVYAEWDPPPGEELDDDFDEGDEDDDLDEDDSPVFPPNTHVYAAALIVDENGDPWWVDPNKQLLKRAG